MFSKKCIYMKKISECMKNLEITSEEEWWGSDVGGMLSFMHIITFVFVIIKKYVKYTELDGAYYKDNETHI